MRSFIFAASCCSFALLAVACALPAKAVLLDWDGNQSVDGNFDGNYDVANSWNPDAIPNAGDMANFNADATYTVTFRSDEEADDFRVIDGVVTFLSDSSTVRDFDITTGAMDGNVSGGQLLIGSETNPVVVNVGDIMNIGSNAPGTSIVQVDGSSSELHAGSAIHNVGRNGNAGILRATNGGTINYGGTIRVGVDNNSQGLIFANLGGKIKTGHLEVATVGSGITNGTVRVSDSGSAIVQSIPGSNLTVGSAAGKPGILEVNNGGLFVAGTGTTTINATGTVEVGLTGDGTFDADGDFNLVGGSLHVGGDAGDVFTLGSGKKLTASAGATVDFDGAHDMTGDFDIQDATLDVDGLLTIGTSTLRLEGGEINANGGLDASNPDSLEFADGTINVTNGVFSPDAVQPLRLGGEQSLGSVHLVLGTGATVNSNFSILVGFGLGEGELTIKDGASATTVVGAVFSRGQATVDGMGSVWEMSDFLQITGGTLSIQNGGEVSALVTTIDAFGLGNNVTAGTIELSGADSTFTNTTSLTVGDNSLGTLNIAAQGQVSNAEGIVGNEVDAIGTTTVDGVGSLWMNTDSLVVGELGQGTLNVTGGGAVSSTQAKLAHQENSTGTVTIDGAGSIWTNTMDLHVGELGDAVLQLTNGGVVSTDVGYFSSKVGSESSVTVAGSGSRLSNSGGLYVGGDAVAAGGRASLSIFDAGLVEVTGPLMIWDEGTVSINGGTLKVDSTAVAGGGTINYAKGTFHLTDAAGYTVGANSGLIDVALGLNQVTIPAGGGLIVDQGLSVPLGNSLTAVASDVTANQLTNDGLLNLNNLTLTTTTGLINNADMVLINTNVNGTVNNTSGSTVTVLGTADFNGLVSGPGNFFGPGTSNFNGGLAIGLSPAEVAFEGNVTLASSNTLFIELGGLLAGDQFDRLSIEGLAMLDGALDVSLIDGFVPEIGDSFGFLFAASGFGGTFDTLNLPDIGPGKEWLLNPGGSTVFLEVRAAFSADFDLDGDVDSDDLNDPIDGWQTRNGTDLDGGNFLDWQRQFGSGVPSVAASATVPEPSSAMLLLTVTAAVILCRRV